MLKMPVMPADLLNEDVIRELGPWSSYGLAEEALKHYYPDEYEKDEDGELGSCKGGVQREAELLHLSGCSFWSDIAQKYQKEVGYNAPDGFHEGAVNTF